MADTPSTQLPPYRSQSLWITKTTQSMACGSSSPSSPTPPFWCPLTGASCWQRRPWPQARDCQLRSPASCTWRPVLSRPLLLAWRNIRHTTANRCAPTSEAPLVCTPVYVIGAWGWQLSMKGLSKQHPFGGGPDGVSLHRTGAAVPACLPVVRAQPPLDRRLRPAGQRRRQTQGNADRQPAPSAH